MSSAARLAEFLKPHRWDSRMLALFLAVAVVMFGLLKLVSEVAEGDTFALDKAILRGLRLPNDAGVPIGPDWLKAVMVDFTALGGVGVLTLVAALAIGYLFVARKSATACFATASIAGGAGLSALIKTVLMRPRPQIVPHLVDVSSASFPSGHSMNAAIVYLTLAALLARSQDRRAVQTYLVGIAIFLALLVGATRVYLGVHWPSDVIAGWAIGALWAAGCSLMAKHLPVGRKSDTAGFIAQPRDAVLFGGSIVVRSNSGADGQLPTQRDEQGSRGSLAIARSADWPLVRKPRIRMTGCGVYRIVLWRMLKADDKP